MALLPQKKEMEIAGGRAEILDGEGKNGEGKVSAKFVGQGTDLHRHEENHKVCAPV